VFLPDFHSSVVFANSDCSILFEVASVAFTNALTSPRLLVKLDLECNLNLGGLSWYDD
jgi:hypothetical protein